MYIIKIKLCLFPNEYYLLNEISTNSLKNRIINIKNIEIENKIGDSYIHLLYY